MIRFYKFADTVLKIDLPEDLTFPENMNLFEIDGWQENVSSAPQGEAVGSYSAAEADHSYTFEYLTAEPDAQNPQISADIPQILQRWEGAACYERNNLTVWCRDGLECRAFFFGGAGSPYAVAEDVSADQTRIWIDRSQQEMFRFDTIYASLFSYERRMLEKDALLLHCAYMKLGDSAVLFSAPSGTGKSTQADLWEKYRGTRTINGDAAIISRNSGRWAAYGWCVCGSSEICHNESYPIRVVVMLRQAKENSCRRLSAREAFCLLYPQIKINGWNSEAQNHAMDRIEDLIRSVPVLELACDISEDAVRCLEKMISE